MTRKQKKINALLLEITGKSMRITPDQKLVEDIGLASFQLMELIAKIEESFNIIIPVNKVMHIRTVGELYQAINDIELLLTSA